MRGHDKEPNMGSLSPQTFSRNGLIARLEATPPAQRPAVLFDACDQFGGGVTKPGKASHLFEVTVFDVHARGDDPEGVFRNWLRAAKNMESEFAARIESDIATTAAALQVIARPDQHPTAEVVTACETVLRIPGDWIAFERARVLLAAIKREEGVAA
jgi:hypothetical protein